MIDLPGHRLALAQCEDVTIGVNSAASSLATRCDSLAGMASPSDPVAHIP
ncbi:hypothetical protein [Streptomyces atratus]|nr:hypothetical protein [Streptomyces atratus]MCX5338860.1 hypothetical protein [Streptomyces atratus]